MFVAILVLIFIVLPIAELFVIIQVGGAIGVWWTIGILIADSVVGSMLRRSEGRAAWRSLNQTLAAGRAPTRTALDGGLVIFGLLLLFPPTRALFRRLIVRRYARRLVVGIAGRAVPPEPGARSDYDVEGTAHEVDPPHLRS